jgi:pimeloyl-ACP methyl ester carboxylesterase
MRASRHCCVARTHGVHADADRAGRARASLDGAINLSTHIEDVLGVFHYERLSDVVLAGHSYGGMVITGVADRIADRSRRSPISMRSCPRMAVAVRHQHSGEHAAFLVKARAPRGGSPCRRHRLPTSA